MNVTKKLLKELNEARGLKYPDIGYLYWADVVGSGIHSPRVYYIINSDGGVTLSEYNAANAKKRCAKIRAAIAEARR